jgi:RimJ/RimL family protein N-acetyltransferase
LIVEGVSTPPSAALPALSTRRLELRPVRPEDVALMVELNADPVVMVHIRGHPATRDETLAEWSQRLLHQSDPARGLGYWAGFENEKFAGWWSASSFAGRPEISGVGYRLCRSAWGRGLATEGARAMVQQAFTGAEVDRVYASTMAVNTASRRVLEKLGMRHSDSWVARTKEMVNGWEQGEVAYELTRAEWQRR